MGLVGDLVDPQVRESWEISGRVQGVGFRPCVYRVARELRLAGFVANTTNGAVLEVEGAASAIERFGDDLRRALPPLANMTAIRRRLVRPLGETEFRISDSRREPHNESHLTPDAATCPDCLAELLDARDRRHRHPFINCTNCGPRYSIIRSVPYDRPATTMSAFPMCDDCREEYRDPADRRFHAQPVACSVCGPRLRLVDRAGMPLAGDPISETARMLDEGRIVAIKGIGGYHLACRADREDVVSTLRRRKIRDGKPLAVMAPNIEAANELGALTRADIAALGSYRAPIVLVQPQADHGLAPSVAPGCATLGLMLPYTPVHHLLFQAGLGPLVMTSANRAGEPLTYRDDEALEQLRDIADAFLTHDREILRPIDDSVVFTFRDGAVPIRRARGFVPEPIALDLREVGDVPPILAVGGELKNTVCLLSGGRAILSEHLGDLTGAETYRHFRQAIERLGALFDFTPAVVAHDLHPSYMSTGYARHCAGVRRIAVQHHHAHIAAVMAEHGEGGPVVGLACDGVGYGTDGAVWGCELLLCERGHFQRVGHLDYFPLLGGDAAAIENWRPAVALLRQAYGPGWHEAVAAAPGLADRFAACGGRTSNDELAGLAAQCERLIGSRLNCPPTSSLGRVFDGVAFLLGLCSHNRHEAEAAMAIEAAASAWGDADPYQFSVAERDDGLRLSVAPAIRAIIDELGAGERVDRIAARFHETLAGMLADAAALAAEQNGISTVAVSGGCFLNRILLERVVARLERAGMNVLYHRQVPAGDGGIALGQAYVSAWQAFTAQTAEQTEPERAGAACV